MIINKAYYAASCQRELNICIIQKTSKQTTNVSALEAKSCHKQNIFILKSKIQKTSKGMDYVAANN